MPHNRKFEKKDGLHWQQLIKHFWFTVIFYQKNFIDPVQNKKVNYTYGIKNCKTTGKCENRPKWSQ